jgi:hypothetical protein
VCFCFLMKCMLYFRSLVFTMARWKACLWLCGFLKICSSILFVFLKVNLFSFFKNQFVFVYLRVNLCLCLFVFLKVCMSFYLCFWMLVWSFIFLSSFEGFWTWFGGFKVFMFLKVCEIESWSIVERLRVCLTLKGFFLWSIWNMFRGKNMEELDTK